MQQKMQSISTQSRDPPLSFLFTTVFPVYPQLWQDAICGRKSQVVGETPVLLKSRKRVEPGNTLLQLLAVSSFPR